MAYLGLLVAVVLDNAFRLLAPDRFGLQGSPPDLPFITALYIGFRARNTSELYLAVWLGVMADCFSVRPLGHFAFLYGAAAYLAMRLRRYVPPDALVSHVVACLFCGLLTAFLALLMSTVTVGGPVGAGFVRALIEAFLSAVCAPIVFGLWDKSRFFRKALGRGFEFA